MRIKEPGVAFVSIFVIMGLTFVLAVSLGERASAVAGQAFGGGIANGGDFQDGAFPPVEFN
jgi:hypothetical protein